MAANLKREKDIYHHGPTPISIICHLCHPSYFSLVSPCKVNECRQTFTFFTQETRHIVIVLKARGFLLLSYLSLFIPSFSLASPLPHSFSPSLAPPGAALASREGDLLLHISLPSLILSLSFSPFLLIIAGQCRTNP